MPSVSQSAMPATWVRRLSSAVDFRYGSDGNSSNYSSVEDNRRGEKQYVPSFMMNDDLSGRSYVDPWDMENYSFLRKQLEDINLSDNELSPPIESAHSDFYYVPLDHKGTPQYRYKHYVDGFDHQDNFSPQSYGDDVHGLMANVDEYDFFNEHLDTAFTMLHDDPYLEFSNPSRQSERSRFNNQDYHTYTPPSIVKGFSDVHPLVPKLRRRASAVTFRPHTHTADLLLDDTDRKRTPESDKSLSDVRIKLDRRKSFHVLSGTPDFKFGKLERRKSFLGHPHPDNRRTLPMEVIPEQKTKEKMEKRTSSVPEMSTELRRKPLRSSSEGILQRSENRGSRLGLNVSFREGEIEEKKNWAPRGNSSLVYVYETARRRRKMFLPSSSSRTHREENFRCGRPEVQDVFSLDPIEQYLNRPSGRYTMTSYGHLKIDYSCSWNYLDKCIAQRVCM